MLDILTFHSVEYKHVKQDIICFRVYAHKLDVKVIP